MPWYLAGLLFSLFGLGFIDYRYRLALFAQAARTVATVAVSVSVFLVWDLLGIGLHVFFIGENTWLTGITIAPNLPVEEPVFLTLLCYTILLLFVWLSGERARRGGERARRGGER
jgi:lycopene cyclase domain-containing protein